MKRKALKRCEYCGRVYDGFECPECGHYATMYEYKESDALYAKDEKEIDDAEDH